MEVPLNNLLIMDAQISGVDDQDGGDGDGVANPGESILLSLDIINESMELMPSNIEITLSSTTDGIEVLADVGVKAIIQPGGSINDKKVIEAANNAVNPPIIATIWLDALNNSSKRPTRKIPAATIVAA